MTNRCTTAQSTEVVRRWAIVTLAATAALTALTAAPPADATLRSKSGTCRDYAWLMIEALRRLGFASRFVSGYLYDSALDGGEAGMLGSGATHAWLQVFLPGAGWTHYDPTNRINAGYDLIPVAIARHPGQAIPLAGSWFGNAQDYLGMSVNVAVRKLGDVSEPSVG